MKKKKKLITKVLLIVGGTVLSLLLLVLIAVAVFLVTLPRDIPPFDDSHLALADREPLPAELNAGTHYLKLYSYDFGEGAEDGFPLLSMMQGHKEWDDAILKSECDKIEYQSQLEHIKEGNQFDQLVLPEDCGNGGDGYGCFSDQFYKVFACRVQSAIRTGQFQEVLSELRIILEMGMLTQRNGLMYSSFDYGTGAYRRGLLAARKLAQCKKLNAEQFMELQNIIDDVSPSAEGNILAYKRKYASSAEGIDITHTAEFSCFTSSHEPIPATLFEKFVQRTFIQPNRSKRFEAGLCSVYIQHATNCYSEIDFGNIQDEIDLMEAQCDLRGLARLRVPNALGLLYCLSSADNYFLIEQYLRDAEVKAVSLIIALHRYKLQHGSLPTGLESLVPDFLPSVPTDPFDGQPMRYNAEKGVVYSVGEDLKDSGGSATQRTRDYGPMRRDAEDYVFGVEREVESFANE